MKRAAVEIMNEFLFIISTAALSIHRARSEEEVAQATSLPMDTLKVD